MKNEAYQEAFSFVQTNIKYIINQINSIDSKLNTELQSKKITKRDYTVLRKIILTFMIFKYTDGKFNDQQMGLIFEKANEISDVIPSISSSSVDRYLKDDRLINYISEDNYNYIQQVRLNNKLEGNKQGGINSYKVNNTKKR